MWTGSVIFIKYLNIHQLVCQFPFTVATETNMSRLRSTIFIIDWHSEDLLTELLLLKCAHLRSHNYHPKGGAICLQHLSLACKKLGKGDYRIGIAVHICKVLPAEHIQPVFHIAVGQINRIKANTV